MFDPKPHPQPTARPWRTAFIAVVALIAVAAIVAGIVFVAASVVLGIYTANLSSTFDSATKVTAEEMFPAEETRPAPAAHGAQNILLMGSDTRDELSNDIDDVTRTRSDTMMVVHISAERDSVEVMSIMRDSWVDIPGHGKAKMNAALSYGGVPLAVQTVESLIGSRIDHVAIIDFEGFKGVTEALGGVEIDNPIAFDSFHMKGKSFAKGPTTLSGEESLAFVRERYAFTDGDYQRVRNQQIFIQSVLREVLSAETLTNPATIADLVSSITPFLTLDEGFTSTYAAHLAIQLRDIRMDDMRFFTMPTTGPAMEGKAAVVHVDWDELSTIERHFRDDTLSDYVVPKRAE